jgi:hypothetical protein
MSALGQKQTCAVQPECPLWANSGTRKLGLCWLLRLEGGQLLAVLIVPPIVGLVTYFVVRLLWERDENGANEGHSRNELEGPKIADPPPT